MKYHGLQPLKVGACTGAKREGQSILYSGQNQSHPLHWPGKRKNEKISLNEDTGLKQSNCTLLPVTSSKYQEALIGV